MMISLMLNDDDDHDDDDDWLLPPQSQILLHNERDKTRPKWGDTTTRGRSGCCWEEWGRVVTIWATITTFSSLAAEYRPPDIIGSPTCSSVEILRGLISKIGKVS